ncbi:MAG: TrkH family potassium uptake protein [Planctomycetes bacterium]|nr:TrkH family potassium uptake protein [Planctomycetota bacterium]
MTFRGRVLKAHPASLVLVTFLLAIALGTALLCLPGATTSESIPVLDAAFTSTSAVCVTGLVVVDTGTYFTTFGQVVILVLIQIGGLGVMTISVALFRWLGRSVSFHQRMVMQDLFAHTPREDIYSLVKSVIAFTLSAETIGAALLAFRFADDMPLADAVYSGVFHSISAFCNAGFALFPDSLVKYRGDLLVNGVVCGLIILGGIGFPVLYDLQSRFLSRDRRSRLSVQTKTVLVTTLILIVAGAIMFGVLERTAQEEGASVMESALTSVFQSVTCRTAGFNTVDIGALSPGTIAAMLFLMFFGASPGSCGGGVKTTTLAILVAFTLSRLRRNRRVNLFHKSVPTDTVTKSASLVLLSLALVGLALFMILAFDSIFAAGEERPEFLAYLFETVSAFATVGLSMGITANLGAWGKIWIIFMMIVGRVGVLTFSYIILGSGRATGIEYAEENVMIG